VLLSAAESAEHLETMLSERLTGRPLEHVVGWASFCGLRILVSDGVFVPRRRTEVLVRQAARRCATGRVVLDLCCGSGAVGAALLARVPGLEIAEDQAPQVVDELVALGFGARIVRCASRDATVVEARR